MEKHRKPSTHHGRHQTILTNNSSLLDVKRLLHELSTQKAELESQNEELRLTEQRLREMNRLYTDLYDFAPIGYFTFNASGNVQNVNLKGAFYLHEDRVTLKNKPFVSYVAPKYRVAFLKHLDEALDTSRTVACEVKLLAINGTEVDARIESQGWRDPASQKSNIRSIVIDVTERKRIEAELTEAKDHAERASVSKSQFLANMSHEIRTPLGVMLGFTDFLADAATTPPSIRDTLKIIGRNGHHLLSLIDDILDLSKVEANQMRTESIDVDIHEEINHIVDLMGARARAQGLHLEVRWRTPAFAPYIRTDPTRLRQIILNIVGNAIKFSSSGTITLEIAAVKGHRHADGRKRRMPLLQIDVTDQGCGIAKEAVSKLFQMFTQSDASMTRKYGGTGLGLVLAQRLARMLGGDIRLLRTMVGRGSTFRITVAAPPSANSQGWLDNGVVLSGNERDEEQHGAPPQSLPPPRRVAGARVLLVEDAVDNQLLFRRILESNGIDVECVGDGHQGVMRALSRVFDVILMDIQLPSMDGYEAASLLRSKGYRGPIIALSAHALGSDIARSNEVGFNAHLSKPIDIHTLVDAVDKWSTWGHNTSRYRHAPTANQWDDVVDLLPNPV